MSSTCVINDVDLASPLETSPLFNYHHQHRYIAALLQLYLFRFTIQKAQIPPIRSKTSPVPEHVITMASPENSATALAREIIDNTKRLAESTDALAERNSELKGIIDRSYHDFIERDLMARNLVVCRQVSELERVILQKGGSGFMVQKNPRTLHCPNYC